MTIPIRCFTCARILANKEDNFKKLIKDGFTKQEALDKLGVNKYCCRTIMLTYNDI